MLDAESGILPLNGLCVYDGMVIMQIIERLLRSGSVSGRELSHVATLRAKVALGIHQACGLSVDDDNSETHKEEVVND